MEQLPWVWVVNSDGKHDLSGFVSEKKDIYKNIQSNVWCQQYCVLHIAFLGAGQLVFYVFQRYK